MSAVACASKRRAKSAAARKVGSSSSSRIATANNQNSPNLKPQESRNFEAGVKWEFLNQRLSTSLAFYRSENLNTVSTDAMWELERLVSFLTDVDSKFGGLLFFVNANGERQHAEIGGPILPKFTEL